jgi:hypothetical protein
MAVIGSLSVKLGLVTQDWDRQTANAKAQAKGLKDSFTDLNKGLSTVNSTLGLFGVSLGAAGFVSAINSVVKFADEVDDLGKAFDLSTAKVLQFRDALGQSGGKAENAERILGTLFDKVAAARDGNEAAIKQFQQLGISFDDLKKLQPEQTLTKVFDGLAKIGSTYERTAAIKDLLGKGGLGLDVKNLANLMDESSVKFEKNAAALSKVADAADKLVRASEQLKTFATVPLAGLMDKMTETGATQVAAYQALFSPLLKQPASSAQLSPGGFANLSTKGIGLGIDLNADTQLATAFGKGTQAPRQFQVVERQKEAVKEMAKAVKEIAAAAPAMEDTAEELFNVSEGVAELMRQDEIKRKTFTDGWREAFRDYINYAKEATNTGADVFQSVMWNMESAIDHFVQTGKFSFKDFANSVIQDILRIMLRWQMMQIIMGITKAFGFGKAAGASATNFAGYDPMAGVKMAASGGYVDRPTIVGENGAELFVPNRPGTIIPNARMGDFMGQQQPQMVINGTYVANMQAIDTQSATQFLAKNRNAVFAANQSAMRGLPAGR